MAGSSNFVREAYGGYAAKKTPPSGTVVASDGIEGAVQGYSYLDEPSRGSKGKWHATSRPSAVSGSGAGPCEREQTSSSSEPQHHQVL